MNLNDRGNRHQIIREINSMLNLDHPNLVRFYGAYFRENAVELALELMDRKTLRELASAAGRIPEAAMCYVAKHVLRALAYLHENRQIHRDLKPANVCLNSAGEVKVSDFGIAKAMEETAEAETFVGTTFYMSPERVEGGKYVYSADIWSLGIVLVECLAGAFPYDTEVLVAFLSSILEDPSPRPPPGSSPELEDFLQVALQKDPRQRASAKDLLRHPWITGCKFSSQDFASYVGRTFGEH